MFICAAILCNVVAIVVFGLITIDLYKQLGNKSAPAILKDGIESIFNNRGNVNG